MLCWVIISASWEYQVIVSYSLASLRSENWAGKYIYHLPLLSSPLVSTSPGRALSQDWRIVSVKRERERERERDERLAAGSLSLEYR